jgi:hypothetical protein
MKIIFEPSGAQAMPWSLAGPNVICVTFGLLPTGIRNSLPWTAKAMHFSSGDAANSVAPRVKVTTCSGFILSSAWTSIGTLRGFDPSLVETTHRSNPHS